MNDRTDVREIAAPVDLVAAAEDLRPIVERHAARATRARMLSPEVVEALRQSGIFAGAIPRELGGAEADPIVQMMITEALAYADCSAAWCVMVGFTSGGLSAGYASDRAVREIAAGGPWPKFAGVFGANGEAAPTEGGYALTGRWGFASGIHHSPWLIVASRVGSGDAPAPVAVDRPEVRFFIVPTRSVTIEDTWYTVGLEGTGSTHFSVDGLFVSAHMTTPFSAPRRRGGALYRAPLAALLGPGIAGCVLGAARRALDEIVTLAADKVRFRRTSTIAERSVFQRDLGVLSTRLRGARLAVLDTLSDIWAVIEAGDAVSVERFGAFQAANTHAFHTATDIASFAFQYAGAGALFSDHILQKIPRDLMAMGQHISLANENYELGGQALLGTAEHTYITAMRPEA